MISTSVFLPLHRTFQEAPSAYSEVRPNTLSVSQGFLKVDLVFVFQFIHSSTLVLILRWTIEGYSQFGR